MRIVSIARISVASIVAALAIGATPAAASYPACGSNEDHWETYAVHRHVDKYAGYAGAKNWYSRYYPAYYTMGAAGDVYRTTTYCG